MKNVFWALILASFLSLGPALAQDGSTNVTPEQTFDPSNNVNQAPGPSKDADLAQPEPAAKKQDNRFNPGSWFVGKIYDGVTSPTKLFRRKGSQGAPQAATPTPIQSTRSNLPQQAPRQLNDFPQEQPTFHPNAANSQFPFDPYTGLPNPAYRGTRSQSANPSDQPQQWQDSSSAPENQPLPLRAPYSTPYPSYSSPSYSAPSYSSPSYSSPSYSSSSGDAKTQHVSGYFRKNGTYVHSYYRRPRSR